MQQAASELYASIMKFLQHAFEWYGQGKIGHVWSAISRPWELGFRDLVEEITIHSKRVDHLAGVASQAEIRASHLEIYQIREELRETRLQVQQLLNIAIRMPGVPPRTLMEV